MQSKLHASTFAVYRLHRNVILPRLLHGYKARPSFDGKNGGRWGQNGRKREENEENFITKNFMICTSHLILVM